MSKLSNKPWGEVDKSELIRYVIDNPDKAKDIFLKIEKDWQDDPYNRLSYPIADKTGKVYRYGLASALTYAKANKETEVVNKLKKLYKQYGISEGTNMKILEAAIDESPKVIKCKEGEFKVKKHLADLYEYDVYSVNNTEYDTDGILITDERNVYCFLSNNDVEKLKSKI